MTQVRMLVSISGTRDGVDWPERGGLLEVPEAEAASLELAGLAEVADGGAVSVAVEDESDVEVAADVAKPARPVRGRKAAGA